MTSQDAISTTKLEHHHPHSEVAIRETLHYCCNVRVLSMRPDGAITSLYFRALMCTGDLFSVVFPFQHKDGVEIIADDVPVSFTPTWFGIDCKIVKLRIGLPILESPNPRPLTLTAFLPLDPDAIPADVPPLMRIGAEFLQNCNADVALTSNADGSRLIIPY